jgi:hypothetical protein
MLTGANSTLQFPVELFRVVAENLQRPNEKETLRSLALVNTVWRHESQRILFRSLRDNWHKDRTREAHVAGMLMHTRFLETILDHPNRLGAYVQSYSQDGLAVDSTFGWYSSFDARM